MRATRLYQIVFTKKRHWHPGCMNFTAFSLSYLRLLCAEVIRSSDLKSTGILNTVQSFMNGEEEIEDGS